MPSVGGDDDSRLTGQRNENSVLFSLDHLSRNAAPAPTPEPPRTSSSKDDSGLIDLQALVAKAESMRPQAIPQSHLLAPPLGFAPPLGAPMGGLGPGIEGQPKSKLPLLIGAGAGGQIVLMVGVHRRSGLRLGGSFGPGGGGDGLSASAWPVPSAATAEPGASAAASASAAAAASASAAPVRFGRQAATRSRGRRRVEAKPGRGRRRRGEGRRAALQERPAEAEEEQPARRPRAEAEAPRRATAAATAT